MEIRPVFTLDREAVRQVMGGYSSRERYAVRVLESEEQTTFQIQLEELPGLFEKDFRAGLLEDDLDRYEQMLAEGLSRAAWEGEQLVGVGLASAERWNGTLWIWEFHVHPQFQGRGVGRALMESLAVAGRQAGLRTMRVETQSSNVPAIRFYRSLGFQLQGMDVSLYTNDDLSAGEVALFFKHRLD